MGLGVRRLAVVFLVFVCAGLLYAGTAGAVAGFQGPSTSGAGTDPSGSKPESKLWWNDNIWWGSLWDTASARFEIWRLNTTTQVWTSTNVPIDTRSGSRADALWDAAAGKLYVASHIYTQTPATGFPSNLYRYSYNAATDAYTLDAGFPVQINNLSTETLVIDKDSTGQLWATWTTHSGDVWINNTVCTPVCNDATWGTAFTLPVTGNGNLKNDDISSVIAFGGTKIGVMWSNQNDRAMYFSQHLDTDPDTTWGTTEIAYFSATGNLADDHINLKMQAGPSGKVFAATKTSQTAAGQPLNALLVRDPAGTWTNATFGTTNENHTRPIVLFDDEHAVVHVFATSAQNDIVEKTSDIASISFPSGVGTLRIDQSSGVNNATSTKQNVNSTTGLVVVASGGGRYWHHWDALGAPPPPGAPEALFSGTPTSGNAPLTVQFTDQSTGTPTSWAWDFDGDNITDSTLQNPSFQYTAAGTYDVTLTVTDAQNQSDSLTKTDYITVSEPGSAIPFAPVADSYVRSTAPTENNGTKATLRVRGGSTIIHTYLKFTVSGLTGPVADAKLRLVVKDPSSNGGTIYPTSNNFAGSGSPWTETGINWNNAPAATGAALDTHPAAAVGAIVEFDLGSSITGNGTYSFLLKDGVSDLVDYSSRSGTNPPQLVITQSTGPDTTPPTVIQRQPGINATGVAHSTNVSATFSEEVLGVSGTTFTLTGPGGQVAAVVTFDSATDTATLNPTTDLAPLTTYTATLTGGAAAIRDEANPANPLVTTQWSFTTADVGPPPSGSIALAGAAISGATASGTSVTLPTWTPAANDLILLSISQRDESKAVTVTGNGLAWTQIADVNNVQGQGGVQLWRAQGASPVTGSIIVTITGNVSPVSVVAQRFSGVSTTTPIEAFTPNAGPGVDNANLLASVQTATPGAWAVAAAWHRGQTLTVPAGETSILVNSAAGSAGDIARASMWYEGPIASPASTQLGALNDLSSAGDWAVVVVSLRPA